MSQSNLTQPSKFVLDKSSFKLLRVSRSIDKFEAGKLTANELKEYIEPIMVQSLMDAVRKQLETCLEVHKEDDHANNMVRYSLTYPMFIGDIKQFYSAPDSITVATNMSSLYVNQQAYMKAQADPPPEPKIPAIRIKPTPEPVKAEPEFDPIAFLQSRLK